MPTSVAHIAPQPVATWINLVVPGAGLIMLGRTRTGLLLGVAFAAAANIALFSRLVIPDDVPVWTQNLSIITACVLYIAAQGLLLGTGRPAAAGSVRGRARRTALAEIERLMSNGEFEIARRVIEANRALVNEDLHVAFRRAQILTEMRDQQALSAWQQLGVLDRHGIYRQERLAALAKVGETAPPVTSPTDGRT